MKKVLVFILLAYLVSCDSVKDFQPDSPPILEITQDAKGMWQYPGRTLFLRLYRNGVIEFEYEDFEKKGKGFRRAEEVNILERAKISADELQKYIGFLRSESFQNAKSKYERNCCCTDASLNYTVHIQIEEGQKNIDLYNFCALAELKKPEPRYAADLPPLLPELLIQADDTRAKYISQ